MKKSYYAVIVVLAGFLIAQVIAVFHVHVSCSSLYESLIAVDESGYLAVPNLHVIPSLKYVRSAFNGGLFFSLSVGVCLSLFAFAAAWFWDRCLSRNRRDLIFFVAIWLVFIVIVNSRGFSVIAFTFFFIIPPSVFWITLKLIPDSRRKPKWPNLVIHFITILILSIILLPQMKIDLFITFRDNFLLSSAVGKTINEFYYKNSLYATEAFRSRQQKLIKTCILSSISDVSRARQIENILLKRDFLIVEKEMPVDLIIKKTETGFDFMDKDRLVIKTTEKEFYSDPDKILKQFFEATDTNALFRLFTLFSIAFVSFIVFYTGCYAFFSFILGLLLNKVYSPIIAGIFCILVGLATIMSLRPDVTKSFNADDLAAVLESNNTHERMAALKFVLEEQININEIVGNETILKSPRIPERYWFANALRFSKGRESYQALIALLDDSYFNVVCRAFYTLGRRGDSNYKSATVQEIMKRIKNSHNWYEQWYAYKALRKLGWSQTKSK